MIKFLVALFTCFFSVFLFGQKTDFSGTWILDKNKSKLDEGFAARVQTQTIYAIQTSDTIKVYVSTEMVGVTNEKSLDIAGENYKSYLFNGSETFYEERMAIGPVKIICKCEYKNGELKLSTSRFFNGSDVAIVTRETWTLASDGMTLNVKRESETPRGVNFSELVFFKKVR